MGSGGAFSTQPWGQKGRGRGLCTDLPGAILESGPEQLLPGSQGHPEKMARKGWTGLQLRDTGGDLG